VKTLAIVGRAKETRDFAPFDKPEVDLWAFNDNAMRLPRVSAVFELHPDALTADRYEPEYKEWLRLPHSFPIWMHETHPEIPASRPYPRHAINALYLYGLLHGEEKVEDFYTSGPAYALALAIYQRYQRIELYGIELYDNGYRKQGDCIFFWLGTAAAHGIEIAIHEKSNLYSSALYPFPTERRHHAIEI
jgi:hypothetical protein